MLDKGWTRCERFGELPKTPLRCRDLCGSFEGFLGCRIFIIFFSLVRWMESFFALWRRGESTQRTAAGMREITSPRNAGWTTKGRGRRCSTTHSTSKAFLKYKMVTGVVICSEEHCVRKLQVMCPMR